MSIARALIVTPPVAVCDVCAARPPFGPGSPPAPFTSGAWHLKVKRSGGGVVVEGVWSLVPARGGRGPFSLGRGLDCGLVLLQTGHHLLGNRVSGNKKGDLSVALAKLGHMRYGSTAGASLRGHKPSCAGMREASAAWRRGSRGRCRTSYSWLGSSTVGHRGEKCKRASRAVGCAARSRASGMSGRAAPAGCVTERGVGRIGPRRTPRRPRSAAAGAGPPPPRHHWPAW